LLYYFVTMIRNKIYVNVNVKTIKLSDQCFKRYENDLFSYFRIRVRVEDNNLILFRLFIRNVAVDLVKILSIAVAGD